MTKPTDTPIRLSLAENVKNGCACGCRGRHTTRVQSVPAVDSAVTEADYDLISHSYTSRFWELATSAHSLGHKISGISVRDEHTPCWFTAKRDDGSLVVSLAMVMHPDTLVIEETWGQPS